jgi:hypothetical protein
LCVSDQLLACGMSFASKQPFGFVARSFDPTPVPCSRSGSFQPLTRPQNTTLNCTIFYSSQTLKIPTEEKHRNVIDTTMLRTYPGCAYFWRFALRLAQFDSAPQLVPSPAIRQLLPRREPSGAYLNDNRQNKLGELFFRRVLAYHVFHPQSER